ncbi:hypothetical protein B0H66DRAFT_548989 [Apodospora peruviana]|uniref:Uncharacterized protein n=1 Tax=Apodospora peruviana TaxID=516989 RepID=A0AAE0IIF7_9PEZI|nr:hypothetical protein B0H66DRAFT_548989 [Apodospora peruviana]
MVNMKGLLGYASVGGALGLANAKALKWSPDYEERRWTPAQETMGFMQALGMEGIASPPTPTTAPKPRGLVERSSTDNTCGYVSGINTNSLYCAASQYCAYNSINHHIGCCDDTKSDCPVWTTCYKSADAKSFTTDNGLTLWCGFTDHPNCVTHLYNDQFSGYTLLGCGVADATDTIFYSSIPTTSSTTSTSSSSILSSSSSSSKSTSSSSTTAPKPGSTDPPPAVTDSQGSSSGAPIGPIVGGVVGGVAALALIGLGIFFLVRQNKKNNNVAPAVGAAAAPPAPPVGGPAPPSNATSPTQMSQHGGYYDPSAAGFAHLDPRASMAKPPYGYDQNISPTSSPPPPGSHSPVPMYNAQTTPPPMQQQQGFPQQQQGYAQQQGYPQQQQQQQQQQYQEYNQGYEQQQLPQQQQSPQQQHYAAELPTQRGDGEARELAA